MENRMILWFVDISVNYIRFELKRTDWYFDLLTYLWITSDLNWKEQIDTLICWHISELHQIWTEKNRLILWFVDISVNYIRFELNLCRWGFVVVGGGGDVLFCTCQYITDFLTFSSFIAVLRCWTSIHKAWLLHNRLTSIAVVHSRTCASLKRMFVLGLQISVLSL